MIAITLYKFINSLLKLWLRDADIAFYVGVNYIIIQGKWKFIELEMDKVS